MIDGDRVGYSRGRRPRETCRWGELGVDVVLECSGQFRTRESLAPYFERRACARSSSRRRSRTGRAQRRRRRQRPPLRPASAPPPHRRLLHHQLPGAGRQGDPRGHRHPRTASITTLHDMTNTQTIVDAPHKDLRRARAASALADPDDDRLGDRDRADLPRARGQARRPRGAGAAAQRVADRLRLRGRAADRPSRRSTACSRPPPTGPLAGILGYEARPLVSVDYKDDPRSAIVDALSTMVIDGTQVKVLAWYDNEWGYANRMVELARKVARGSPPPGDDGWRAGADAGDLRNYALVTGAYWADTLTDGAIRMLVLFYFYELRLHAVRGRLAVPVLRGLRHRHQPRRRLARGPPRAQGDAARGPRARRSSRSRCSRLAPEAVARRCRT